MWCLVGVLVVITRLQLHCLEDFLIISFAGFLAFHRLTASYLLKELVLENRWLVLAVNLLAVVVQLVCARYWRANVLRLDGLFDVMAHA